jgi:tetratricopeptide (TPR) repeat protein
MYTRRGRIHFALRNYELALADFEKTTAVAPDEVLKTLYWILSRIPPATVAACPDEKFRKGMVGLADKTIALLEGKPDTSHRGKALAYESRARLLEAMKQPELARADLVRVFDLYQKELEQQKALLGPEHADTLGTMWRLVQTCTEVGLFNQAEPVLLDLLAHLKRNDVPRVGPVRLGRLGYALLGAQKYAEAEGVLHECLKIREKQLPESWHRFDAASMLGGALLGQKKYKEAEPQLLQGYVGLEQRENRFPVIRLHEAAGRLVHLYEATGQPQKAAQWREKLKAKVE